MKVDLYFELLNVTRTKIKEQERRKENIELQCNIDEKKEPMQYAVFFSS
jgi:hypothetical protein